MPLIQVQALKWDDDGELAAADRLQLLKTLIRQSLPEVQLEFIAVLERSPMLQTQISNQVSIS